MSPPRRPRGLFIEITEGVYWFLTMDVMIVLSSAPTILLWFLVAGGTPNTVLFVIAALPLLPVLAAALYACRARQRDHELIPARHFLRGYRLNALDSLRVGTPALLVLAVLGFHLMYGESAGTSGFTILFLVIGALALLVLVRALSIVSTFSFRTIDVFRLTAFTLLARPLSTLALLSLGVLTLGIIFLVGEFLLLVTASLLVFALWASERPVAQLLTDRFVSAPGPDHEAAAADGPHVEES